jgi:integrase
MVLDLAEVEPNPARDRVKVRFPIEEPREPEPPSAEHVEKAARLLPRAYRLALLVLDATGCRIGELEAARIDDLDEERRAWLVSRRRRQDAASPLGRAAARPVRGDDGATAAREDRDPESPLSPGVTADRLRTALGRACKIFELQPIRSHGAPTRTSCCRFGT